MCRRITFRIHTCKLISIRASHYHVWWRDRTPYWYTNLHIKFTTNRPTFLFSCIVFIFKNNIHNCCVYAATSANLFTQFVNKLRQFIQNMGSDLSLQIFRAYIKCHQFEEKNKSLKMNHRNGEINCYNHNYLHERSTKTVEEYQEEVTKHLIKSNRRLNIHRFVLSFDSCNSWLLPTVVKVNAC